MKTAEGGLLVSSATKVPLTPRDPRGQVDYAQGDWIVENLGE